MRRRMVALAVAGSMLLVGGVVCHADDVEATWVDAEHAVTTVTAATVPSPSAGSCALTDPLLVIFQSVTFTWPAMSGIDGYRWEIVNSAGTVVGSGTLPATATSHKVPADYPGLIAIDLLTTYTFRLVALSGTWESQPRTATFGILLGLGLLGAKIPVVSSCTGLA